MYAPQRPSADEVSNRKFFCLAASVAIAVAFQVAASASNRPSDWYLSLLVLAIAGAVCRPPLLPRASRRGPIGHRWTALLIPAYVAVQLVPIPFRCCGSFRPIVPN